MTRRENLQEATAATQALAEAKRSLNDERFRARNGMASNFDFAAYVEHKAYHRWLRASAALVG